MKYLPYQDLVVWQKAMELAQEIYQLVKLLPAEELYSLSDQMRRAAVSIPSNIAEGRGRGTDKDYKHFLCIAKGSVFELETQLLLCVKINYLTQSQVEMSLSLCSEISKMLASMS